MRDEDEASRPRGPRVDTPPLDPLGIEELQGYIAALRAEIARADAEIARKGAHRSAAEGFFRR